ncbi:endonuclease [Corynebacterium phage Stiles]|uniref:HNH endonuclease n=1 Tax=Corynebacterium phage Stiles TaxID=2588504 RepID=A0A4Y6EMU1_9CAUD|nr:endonuclease [Corynebacterium phage Stiles]QDF20020.1 HNH endonuclease [Corynebacterium phage Stiles]
MNFPSAVVQRFWAKVDIRQPDECWNWQAYLASTGYGQFGTGGRIRYAHRVAFEIGTGRSPAGLVVRHTCDNRACVNPAHLLLGTHADNVRDKVARNRQLRGEQHGGAVLTDAAVIGMRRRARAGEPIIRIAADYGVNYRTAVTAIRGDRGMWNHVTEPPVRPATRSPRKEVDAA